MCLDEFNYVWGEDKHDWVLVNTQRGYSIVNKKTQMVLLISNSDLEEAVIQRMLNEGNLIFDDIVDAYASE